MKATMIPWLVPLGLLATVVAFGLAGPYVAVAIWVAVFLLVVVVWVVRLDPHRHDSDRDTSYWRWGDWGRRG
jgi:hypothetical protein